MLTDLVIDTNVFVHAHNQDHQHFADSQALARKLLEPSVRTVIRVDPGFHPDEARNNSRIMSEYFAQLVPGMLGHHVLQTLAASQRIAGVALQPDRNRRDRVRRLVHDKSDRVFLLVAIESDDKVLASHDDRAFPDSVRAECRSRWATDVCEAGAALSRI